MFRQTIDWVYTGAVVASDFSTGVFDVCGAGFWLSGKWRQTGVAVVCSQTWPGDLSLLGIPKWAGIPCWTTVYACGRSYRSFSSWWIGWSEVLEIRD